MCCSAISFKDWVRRNALDIYKLSEFAIESLLEETGEILDKSGETLISKRLIEIFDTLLKKYIKRIEDTRKDDNTRVGSCASLNE